MFSSSLLAFAIAALTVQAAIIPARIRDVPDAVVDIVLTIDCTPLDITGSSGSLVITDKSSLTEPLALVNNVLQEDGVAYGERQSFVFQNCTSTFMNLTPSATTYYGSVFQFLDDQCRFGSCLWPAIAGSMMKLTILRFMFYRHITPSSNSSACLSSSPGLTTPQNITTAPCSISDDSGQMLQFWVSNLL